MKVQKQPAKGASKRSGGKSPKPGFWRWSPLLLGILVTPIAVKIAEILPLIGKHGLFDFSLLFPYAMLLKAHAPGFSEPSRESLAHVMLYAQFPLYGLYGTIALERNPWPAILTRLAAIHIFGFGLLVLLTRL